MSEQWRIFVVEDDENLNRTIVTSLHKDGYVVQGAMNITDARRMLWAEEFDVVICDLKAPQTDNFELLQWLRSFRPNTLVLIAGRGEDSVARTQALEHGATNYLERPLDVYMLKGELRRLSQQTGFSASLDSFDLLDVIQIITMSRKSIALLVNIGLEERGILRFQGGELIWAEYGLLRGEEAFFALAAHKNGTVIHQAWNEQIRPNVTQPLSRLIFQALQYRAKYAMIQQLSGEQPIIRTAGTMDAMEATGRSDEDGSPFQVLTEYDDKPFVTEMVREPKMDEEDMEKEWWQQTGKFPSSNGVKGYADTPLPTPSMMNGLQANSDSGTMTPSIPQKIAMGEHTQREDLPSWLTDQSTTASGLSAAHSSAPQVDSARAFMSSDTPSAEWQVPPTVKTTGPIGRKTTDSQKVAPKNGVPIHAARRLSSPEWQALGQDGAVAPQRVSLQSVQSLAQMDGVAGEDAGRMDMSDVTLPHQIHRSSMVKGRDRQQAMKQSYDYPALVSALQTVGYSVKGFIAAAVVTLDGQPIAQVAVDEQDISSQCKNFSVILNCIMQSLDQSTWGLHEETITTHVDRHILMRVIGRERKAFQVLITSREANPLESQAVMANVEDAIAIALR